MATHGVVETPPAERQSAILTIIRMSQVLFYKPHGLSNNLKF